MWLIGFKYAWREKKKERREKVIFWLREVFLFFFLSFSISHSCTILFVYFSLSFLHDVLWKCRKPIGIWCVYSLLTDARAALCEWELCADAERLKWFKLHVMDSQVSFTVLVFWLRVPINANESSEDSRSESHSQCLIIESHT